MRWARPYGENNFGDSVAPITAALGTNLPTSAPQHFRQLSESLLTSQDIAASRTARWLPLQGRSQGVRIHDHEPEIGHVREILRRRLGGLLRGGEMNEPIME
jgi:hypothetical protein